MALCTFNEVVAGKKVSWVLECDLKNFFGSLDMNGFFVLSSIGLETPGLFVS